MTIEMPLSHRITARNICSRIFKGVCGPETRDAQSPEKLLEWSSSVLAKNGRYQNHNPSVTAMHIVFDISKRSQWSIEDENRPCGIWIKVLHLRTSKPQYGCRVACTIVETRNAADRLRIERLCPKREQQQHRDLENEIHSTLLRQLRWCGDSYPGKACISASNRPWSQHDKSLPQR